MLILTCYVKESTASEIHSGVRIPLRDITISESRVFQLRDVPHKGRILRLQRGVVLAQLRSDLSGRVGFENDVDYAGNCVRAVLRSSPVAKDFDALDCARRNCIEIDTCRASADRSVHVHESRRVATLSIHENENLIGT